MTNACGPGLTQDIKQHNLRTAGGWGPLTATHVLNRRLRICVRRPLPPLATLASPVASPSAPEHGNSATLRDRPPPPPTAYPPHGAGGRATLAVVRPAPSWPGDPFINPWRSAGPLPPRAGLCGTGRGRGQCPWDWILRSHPQLWS